MIAEAVLLRLLAWLSPAFPTGAFACSHGLEWAVEAGDVTDRASAADWIGAVLRHGALRADAILLRHAHRAAGDGDAGALAELAELAAAACPSRERRQETLSQGTAFAAAALVWGAHAASVGPVALPVAVGAVGAAHGVAQDALCAGFLQAGVGTLVSAAVRLVPLGQTDGLRIAAGLEASVLAVAAGTAGAGLDELGGLCLRGDLAAMRHETQHTRLFRT